MKHALGFWASALCVGIVLSLYALSEIASQSLRPSHYNVGPIKSGEPILDMDITRLSWLSLDRDLMAALSLSISQRSFRSTATGPAERSALNTDAQNATRSALAFSPVNPELWLILSQLKTQNGEVSAGPLKMSYVTGQMATDEITSRIRSVAISDAINDEDIRLLAQADIRRIFTRNAVLQPELAAIYRDSPPNGKKYLLDVIDSADPGFARLLRQYP